MKSSTAIPHEQLPDPIDEDAFYGLAGVFARTVEPHTESDSIAILVQFLVFFGNIIGRNAFAEVEATPHFMNLYAVMVGDSAKGRKGTGLAHVKRAFLAVSEEYIDNRIMSGLSSGEGLIHAVRDPVKAEEPVKEKGRVISYQTVIKDQGESDKRVLVTESEFSRTLKVMEREGCTLSALLRDGWDTGKLRVMTKSPQKATDAHISIIGHITRDELRRYLTNTEAGNGFANRFLWIHQRRSKLLPDGGNLHTLDMESLYTRLREAVEFASRTFIMKRDDEARAAWHTIYPVLTHDVPGLIGAVTSRAEAQVLRLSCIYALLDLSETVRRNHLMAALAVWGYAEESARYIFGEAMGDPVTDTILQALKNAPNGLTRTQITGVLGNHCKANRITQALLLLQAQELVMWDTITTGGRPAEIWKAIG